MVRSIATGPLGLTRRHVEILLPQPRDHVVSQGIGNGRLVSTGDNPPDANFPAGSTSWHWRMPEPVGAYLVENSIGSFDWSERAGGNGVLYYEAQDSNISAARKALNKNAMKTLSKASPVKAANFTPCFAFCSNNA